MTIKRKRRRVPRLRRWRLVYVWHRRIGLAAAALILIVAVTGVLLNHGDTLGLNDRRVSNGPVLAWYGLAPEVAPVSYPVGKRWLSWLAGRVYLDGRPVAEDAGEPKGALALEGAIVLASENALLLLSPAGRIVERIGSAGLPGSIEAIGADRNGQLVVKTGRGRFRFDRGMVGWRATDDEPHWAVAKSAPMDVRQKVLRAWRGPGPPWSRVLLDVHTGRILGAWGTYLMDAAALCLLLLLGTGLYNWLKGRR